MLLRVITLPEAAAVARKKGGVVLSSWDLIVIAVAEWEFVFANDNTRDLAALVKFAARSRDETLSHLERRY